MPRSRDSRLLSGLRKIPGERPLLLERKTLGGSELGAFLAERLGSSSDPPSSERPPSSSALLGSGRVHLGDGGRLASQGFDGDRQHVVEAAGASARKRPGREASAVSPEVAAA